MSERLYRTQILLYPEQFCQLREIAQREKRSISDVSRELLEDALRRRGMDKLTRKKRIAQAHEVAEQILYERNGNPIEVDVVSVLHQAREERIGGLGGHRR